MLIFSVFLSHSVNLLWFYLYRITTKTKKKKLITTQSNNEQTRAIRLAQFYRPIRVKSQFPLMPYGIE